MKNKLLILPLLLLFFVGCNTAVKKPSNVSGTQNVKQSHEIEFVDIPGNGDDIKPFKMGKTEVTNQQYVNFLNAALIENKVSVGKIEPTNPKLMRGKQKTFRSKNQQLVYDKQGNIILNLLNIRATGDHNKNGVYDMWEMRNPLNRCMIEYDYDKKKFNVVDPEKVDWQIYFDNKHLPPGVKTVDSITNWPELQKFWPKGVTVKGRPVSTWKKADYGKDILFAGPQDLDFKLPTLEEVKKWPVNYIFYNSAKVFIDYYGFDFPTFYQFRWAKAGGKGYEYGTNDGTITTKNVVYSGRELKEYPKLPNGAFDWKNWPGKSKGHVQAVDFCPPNPYGVHDTSGNVIEWTKTRNSPKTDCEYRGAPPGFQTFISVGGGFAYYKEAQSLKMRCIDTPEFVTNDHFGFRVVKK